MKQFHLYKSTVREQNKYLYVIQKTKGLLDILAIGSSNPYLVMPLCSNSKDYIDLGIPSAQELKDINIDFYISIKTLTILHGNIVRNISRGCQEFIQDVLVSGAYSSEVANTENLKTTMSLRRTLPIGVLQEYVETRIRDTEILTEAQ